MLVPAHMKQAQAPPVLNVGAGLVQGSRPYNPAAAAAAIRTSADGGQAAQPGFQRATHVSEPSVRRHLSAKTQVRDSIQTPPAAHKEAAAGANVEELRQLLLQERQERQDRERALQGDMKALKEQRQVRDRLEGFAEQNSAAISEVQDHPEGFQEQNSAAISEVQDRLEGFQERNSVAISEASRVADEAPVNEVNKLRDLLSAEEELRQKEEARLQAEHQAQQRMQRYAVGTPWNGGGCGRPPRCGRGEEERKPPPFFVWEAFGVTRRCSTTSKQMVPLLSFASHVAVRVVKPCCAQLFAGLWCT